MGRCGTNIENVRYAQRYAALIIIAVMSRPTMTMTMTCLDHHVVHRLYNNNYGTALPCGS